ncbi:DUF3037 domain-containing protein [Mycobacterium intracellulare]|uniref:DUF3037 domain-containing protein n=1 Tax=Mycobacterium intracellulare TaxID=1767 RepID=UPI000BAF66CA|nr:DUF3037 domain-containing protein [Mycobacterium intracellulare]PBA57414.1 hypothetical protein CKJ57_23695 [Mycobacterium intracellulare subsp. chimaera]
MGRYRYSLVRCVPEPRTGEFINIGAIAGSYDEGDWSTRQISNFQRAAKLCANYQLGAVTEFLAEVTRQISDADESLFPLQDSWLDTMASEWRNVVQLSPPQLAVGESADQVLDFVFARQLIDPARSSLKFVSKTRLLAGVRRFAQEALNADLIVERPVLTVGDRITTPVDFAFGRNKAVQLTQAWSFQKETVDDVARDVKAWGYAISRLRDGSASRLEGGERSLQLDENVPIDVLIAEPTTAHQHEVFEEASDVFHALKANVYQHKQSEELVEHIVELLPAA